jgi:hypothetical protein
MSELKLQAECFQDFWNCYPEKRGLLFMNYNNPKNAAHGAILKGLGLVAGVADMTYLSPDGAVFLEFKFGEGRQAPAQKKWQEAVEAVGYRYFLIYTKKDFTEALHIVDKSVYCTH